MELDIRDLKAWPRLELQNVSGLATYTTRIDLPNWTAAQGATLSLGEVFDSFALTVNNQAVSVDQISAVADLGGHLKAGRNTIAVRVATTLNNRLAKIDDDVARGPGRALSAGGYHDADAIRAGSSCRQG